MDLSPRNSSRIWTKARSVPNKSFDCKYCNLSFKRSSSLRVHLCGHEEEKSYQCHNCDLKFSFLSSLRKHRECHKSTEAIRRPFTMSPTTQVQSLLVRVQESSEEGPLPEMNKNRLVSNFFHLYGKTFAMAEGIRRKALSQKEQRRPCPQCQKMFYKKSQLERHLLSHTGEKPHQCQTCGKCFSLKGNLKTHSTIHSGQRPFTCAHCQKTFVSRSSLWSHSLLHEKSFPCTRCDQKFSLKQHLKQHKSIHLHERISKFETSSPASQIYLDGQLPRDSERKEHPCTQCDETFETKSLLKRHASTHLHRKSFPCPLCPADFTCEQVLERHLSSHSRQTNLAKTPIRSSARQRRLQRRNGSSSFASYDHREGSSAF